uniref:mRNA_decap_C domain-containing protein n=1 Tax=Parastrongyloides trichosuri TaxID=131310 RepID=A0A0N4Z457_PARTI
MADKRLIQANADNNTVIEKSYSQIRRIDSTVESVIALSKYTAVYDFVNGTWVKTDIDGPMFVYKRNAKQEFGICIANRTSTPDFIETISYNLRLKFKPPYILAYFPSGKIKGLWFYDSSQCSKIYNVMQRLIEKCSQEAENVDIQEPEINTSNINIQNSSDTLNHISSNNALAQMLGNKLKISESMNDNTINSVDSGKCKIIKSPSKGSKIDTSMSCRVKKEVMPVAPNNSGLSPQNDNICGTVPGLTKEQFKAAFINLLNSDDSFLTSLHNSYGNVLAEAMGH